MRSYLKNYRIEPSKWKDIKELYYPRAASLIYLVLLSQADKNGLVQPKRSLLIYHLRFVVKVRNTCNHLPRLYFKDKEFWSFGSR